MIGRVSFRLFYCWYFFLWSLIFLLIGLSEIFDLGSRTGLPIRSPLSEIGIGLVILVLGTLFGVATIILWRGLMSEKLRRQNWVLVAFLSNFLIVVAMPLTYHLLSRDTSLWEYEHFFIVPQVIASVGLIWLLTQGPQAIYSGCVKWSTRTRR